MRYNVKRVPLAMETELVGLLKGFGVFLDSTTFIDTRDAEHAVFSGALATSHKAAQGFNGALEVGRVIISHGHDVVEGFVFDARVDHDTAINEGF